MKKFNYLLLFVFCLFVSVASFAQALTTEKPEMAVGMRSNGKIYVVVAVVVTILAGLFFYLINLDRKITRLERESSAN